MARFPSIFNDVIGPVMRGPSSSHCAASLRIGRLCRSLMGGEITKILIEFDPNGSLATTHDGQGSDMGLFGGFLGWEADDDRLVDSEDHLRAAGIDFDIVIRDIGADHPNTYQITLWNTKGSHQMIALSTGGGMIDVINIDGATVSMEGDFYETLVFTDSEVKPLFEADEWNNLNGILEIKSQEHPGSEYIEMLENREDVKEVKVLEPVVPVKSRKGLSVPFITVEEMLAFNEGKNLSLWELAVEYEKQRGNISSNQVFEQMRDIVRIMKGSVQNGLAGTSFEDRILGAQSVKFKEKFQSSGLIPGDLLNRAIMYVSAIMEVKSSMGVIVAAPTAGSCGTLPGTLIAAAESLDSSEDELVKAMLIAGLIGVYIAAHSTFAAEVGGCQSETGAGGTMAAAGLVYLAGGNLNQSLAASSLALQNSLGIVCDPIANRVEAPCLGKNVMAASNAFSCSNMALADYDPLIPLDEVIGAMDEVGRAIDSTLRCTSLGGLAITKTAREIQEKLAEKSLTKFKSC